MFGHNRKNTHINAKKGSGGVGFFVKQAFLKHYAVSRVDDNFEGILWLKFCPLNGGPEFLGCVCYLPPIESTRNIDGANFLTLFYARYTCIARVMYSSYVVIIMQDVPV